MHERQTKNGDLQGYLCRSCRHRFSNSKIKVDVIKQHLVPSDAVHDLGNLNLVNVGVGDVVFQDSKFASGEDVGSHRFPSVRKRIDGLLHNLGNTEYTPVTDEWKT
jgi:hypothetical protein